MSSNEIRRKQEAEQESVTLADFEPNGLLFFNNQIFKEREFLIKQLSFLNTYSNFHLYWLNNYCEQREEKYKRYSQFLSLEYITWLNDYLSHKSFQLSSSRLYRIKGYTPTYFVKTESGSIDFQRVQVLFEIARDYSQNYAIDVHTYHAEAKIFIKINEKNGYSYFVITKRFNNGGYTEDKWRDDGFSMIMYSEKLITSPEKFIDIEELQRFVQETLDSRKKEMVLEWQRMEYLLNSLTKFVESLNLGTLSSHIETLRSQLVALNNQSEDKSLTLAKTQQDVPKDDKGTARARINPNELPF